LTCCYASLYKNYNRYARSDADALGLTSEILRHAAVWLWVPKPCFAGAIHLKIYFLAAIILSGFSLSNAQQKPDEKKLRITSITFEGARVFSQEQLRGQLRSVCESGFINSRLGCDIYDPSKVTADLARVRQFLADHGYLRPFIGEPRIEYLNPQDAQRQTGTIQIRLVIPIGEGSLHRLRRISVAGATVMSNEQASSRFKLKSGDVARSYPIEEGIERLRETYGRLGYLRFSPTFDFNFIPGTGAETLVDLTINLNEGRAYRVGAIAIEGNTHARASTIRRIIPLAPGEIFDYSKWLRGLEELNRTGLFEPVKPSDPVLTYDDASATANVALHITERKHQRVDFSGGGGSVGGVTGGFDYTDTDVTGRADRLLMQTRYGTLEKTITGDYAVVIPLTLPVRAEVSSAYQDFTFVQARSAGGTQEPLFVQRTYGANLDLSIPLEHPHQSLASPTRAGFVYSFTSTDVSNIFGLSVPSTSPSAPTRIDIGSITPALSHYTLDRTFDPTRGQFLFVGAEIAGRGLGGDLNYARPFLDYRFFVRVGRQPPPGTIVRPEERREPRVFGFRLRFAHVTAFASQFNPQTLSAIDGIPKYKRYFLGGPDQVRGYALNSISPLATVKQFLVVSGQPPAQQSSDIRPIGGDSEAIFNAEYRIPLKWRFSAAVFYDIGSSFNLFNLGEERFQSPTTIQPLGTPATILTTVVPLGPGQGRLPAYRMSTGAEFRFQLPFVNVPLRLILAVNPNAQKNVPVSALLAPEKRVVFLVSFGRTL